MQFRLLGPLVVEHHGRAVEIRGAKERALLALLLLRANELVSRDHLIDELWGDRPPATATHTLEAHVSRLRKALAAGGNGALIETVSGGYVLHVEDGDVDTRRFERLLEHGKAELAEGHADEAEEALAAALALWRGDVLGDVEFEPYAAVEAARLSELRLEAVEARLEAALALGRHDDVVAELQALVAQEPLREHLRGQLMLALYRSGRQADALEAYREGRRLLVEELGIEPGTDLQELHAAILRHDPDLEAPAPPPARADGRRAAAPAVVPPSPPPRRRGPRTFAAAGVVVAALAAAFAYVGLRVSADDPPPTPLAPNAVGVIDPAGDALVAQVPVGARPVDVAVGNAVVWVANAGDGTVSRIDAAARRLVRSIPVPGGAPAHVAAGGAGSGRSDLYRARSARLVWVSDSDGVVRAIDPAFDDVAERVRIRPSDSRSPFAPPPAETLAVLDGSLWVADRGGFLSRIDVRGRRVVGRLDLATDASALAVGAGSVWVAARSINAVLRIDPNPMRVVDTIPVAKGPAAIAFGHGSIWVAADADGVVSRVDVASGRETLIRVGDRPIGIAASPEAVWVARHASEVIRIDPGSNRVVARIRLGPLLSGIAAGAGAVWVTAVPSEAR